MKKVQMRDVIGLLEGGKKEKPKKGDLFVMYMRGIGFIPGLVVKDDFRYGKEKLCVIYLYSEFGNDENFNFLRNKERLIVPPALVTEMDWRGGGGFRNTGHLNDFDMNVFSSHCFYDRLKNRYIDDSGEVCEKSEPCGLYAISNIGAEAIGIYEKLNPDVEVVD
ncbi:hypothetical protein [Paraburkholderia xenovorans]|jgi:hypothetical protein